LKVFGLVGGIASGKSAVASFFHDQGATVLDADRIAHDVLQRPAVVEQLVARWGAGVIDADRRPVRAEIAQRVFGVDREEELQWLESVIHPLVHHELKEQLRQNRQLGTEFVVLDVPLLLERGWEDECDTVLFIDTPLETRRQRAAGRGWRPGELERREGRQWSTDRKRAAADHVVENSGNLASLHKSLAVLLED